MLVYGIVSLTSVYVAVPQSGLIMESTNASITFTPGKTYRLRLINMSAFSEFFFSIDGHAMDIIEVDGVDVQRHTVTSVSLTAAQRISVLVTAKNDTSLNYYMHADMNTDMFDTVPPELQPSKLYKCGSDTSGISS